MRLFKVIALLLVVVCSGCAAGKVSKPVEVSASESLLPVAVESEGVHGWKYQGRIFVIGNEKTNQAFQEHKHLPYTKTLIGAGPMGETVVFEVDKKDPALAESLVAAFESTPFLLESAQGYNVWKYKGRIYVIGNEKTNEAFKQHKHLPYTKTLIGAGPMGETVVFEVDKKDPALAERLVATFKK